MSSRTKTLLITVAVLASLVGFVSRVRALIDNNMCEVYGICEDSYETYYETTYESGYQGGYQGGYQLSYEGGYQNTYQYNYESSYGGYEYYYENTYQYGYESGYNQGPSCGAAGGNQCGGSCPAGDTTTTIGNTYDCSPCLSCTPTVAENGYGLESGYEHAYQNQYQISYGSNNTSSNTNVYYADPGYVFTQVQVDASSTGAPDGSADVSLCYAGSCIATSLGANGQATLGPIGGNSDSYQIVVNTTNQWVSISVSSPQQCATAHCGPGPTPNGNTGTVCVNQADGYPPHDYYISGPGGSWTGAGSQCWGNEPVGHYDATADGSPNISSLNSDLTPGGTITIGINYGSNLCQDQAAANYNQPAPCVYCVAGAGNACSSSSNSCGMTNQGTIQCGGGCSVSAPADNECPAPTAVSPTYSTPNYCQSGPGGFVAWSYSDPNNSPQASYQVQVATGGSFGSPVYDSTQVNSTSHVLAIPNGVLQFNATYSARVRVWNTLGSVSAWAGTSNWTTAPYAYPQVSFTYSPTPLQKNVAETFTDHTTFGGGNVNARSWNWSFGDGGTAATQNPSHTYANTGSYTISETATDAAGQSCTSTLNSTVQKPTPVIKEVAPK